MTADEIITRFSLARHPEGGWYRQTWAADAKLGERASGTAILYLLRAGEGSHWHRVDATEIWHFHAGAPLQLCCSCTDFGPASLLVLGNRLERGDMPQAIVPAHHWQSAKSLGDWSLVGCTVSPGFRFEGFELAAETFDIPLQCTDTSG